MPPEPSASPLSPPLCDLGDICSLRLSFLVVMSSYAKRALDKAAFLPSCKTVTMAVALEPAQLLINVTLEFCICLSPAGPLNMSCLTTLIVLTHRLAAELGPCMSVSSDSPFHSEGFLLIQ